jgi:hypothetical protein
VRGGGGWAHRTLDDFSSESVSQLACIISVIIIGFPTERCIRLPRNAATFEFASECLRRPTLQEKVDGIAQKLLSACSGNSDARDGSCNQHAEIV